MALFGAYGALLGLAAPYADLRRLMGGGLVAPYNGWTRYWKMSGPNFDVIYSVQYNKKQLQSVHT